MPAVAHGAEAAHQAGGVVTASLEEIDDTSIIERILNRLTHCCVGVVRQLVNSNSSPRPHLTAYRVIDPTTASPSPWRSLDDAPRAESRPVRDVCRRVLALARGRRAPGRRASTRVGRRLGASAS